MCLERATNLPKKKTGIGYKVFCVDSVSNIIPEFAGNKPIPVGEWVKEQDRRPGLFDNGHSRCSGKVNGDYITPSYSTVSSYPLGFHILRYKKHALHYAKSKHGYPGSSVAIHKVQYRKVCYAGTIKETVHHEPVPTVACKIVVAKEMKVLERIVSILA